LLGRTRPVILDRILLVMLKYGTWTSILVYLSRNLLLEFGCKVLGLREEWLRQLAAFHDFQHQPEAAKLLQVRILAYASATWLRHASAIKRFIEFCAVRELSLFESTPYIVNLFLLHRIQDGASIGSLESFLDALALVLKFFGVYDFSTDPMIKSVLKFAQKACVHINRQKSAFGSAEVRAIWDSIDQKYGGINNVPKNVLRTFMLAVFQHQTFCRFSDVAKISLADMFHEVDYFKIKISFSKTDQGGEGQWVFLPKSQSPFRDSHMLLCLYIQRMDFPDSVSPEKLFLFPPLK
jgi:hypothetical protein